MSKIKESLQYSVSKQLGCRLMKEGKYAEAEPMFQILVDCRLKVLGYASTETASAYQMLAFVMEKQGKYEEALKQYESALKAYNAAHKGEGHPDADFIYACMVKIYRNTKQFDQALAKSQRLLKIRLEKLGNAHPKTALSYHNVAICFYDQHKHKEALDTLNKALKVQQEAGDGDTHGIAGIYTTMAKILVEQGRFAKAMEIYQRVLRHQVKVFGHYSPPVALTYRNVGLAYQSQANTVQAWKACVEALRIYSKLMEDEDNNDPKTAAATWRKQCPQDFPHVIRAEAKKTLQITKILEKHMAKAILPSPEKIAASAVATTATTIGTISRPITNLNAIQNASQKTSAAAAAATTSTKTGTAALPTKEAATDSSTKKVTQKRKLDNDSNKKEGSNVTKKQKVQALKPSATETASASATAPVASTRTTTTSAAAKPSVTQKLVEKLRQIEALEEKGLFHLTQEEITMLSWKPEIMNQLAAFAMLGMGGLSLPNSNNKKNNKE